ERQSAARHHFTGVRVENGALPGVGIEVDDPIPHDERVVQRRRVGGGGGRPGRLAAVAPVRGRADAGLVDDEQAIGAAPAPLLLAGGEVDAEHGVVVDAVALLDEDVRAEIGHVPALAVPAPLPQQRAVLERDRGADVVAAVGGRGGGVDDEQVLHGGQPQGGRQIGRAHV